MKDTRRRTSRDKPGIVFAGYGNAGAAGSEAAFIGQRSRKSFRHERLPGLAVGSHEQRKFSIHRIAHSDAMLVIPEGKAIVKGLRIGIGELQLPCTAAIVCLVDSRLIAVADAQYKRLAS